MTATIRRAILRRTAALTHSWSHIMQHHQSATPARSARARLRGLLRLARLPFMAGGIVVHGLGVAVALLLGHTFSWQIFLLGQVVITSAQLMNAASNDYFDLETDTANQTYTRWTGGSRALADGLLAPRDALLAASVLAVLAVLASLVLAFGYGTGTWTVPLVLIAVLWAWFYSAPPVKMHSRGLGEVGGALLMSVFAPMVGFYLQTDSWHPLLALVVAPFFFLQVAMLIAVSVPDAEADAATGKLTLFVRLGGPRTARLYAACLGLGFALFAPWPLAGIPWWIPLATLVGIPPGLYLAGHMLRGGWADATFFDSLSFWTIHVLMSTMALIVLGFLVDHLLA